MDILEAVTETEAVCTGKILILLKFLICSFAIQIIFLQYIIIPMIFPFVLDIASKPMESLEQITTFDVEMLLCKSATLSENSLLQLQQSLTKEWGTGSVGILPKDFIQKLLTEEWSIENHSSIIHIITSFFNPFFPSKLPFS